MAKAIYVKFDTPEELANQAEEALKTAQDSGKRRCSTCCYRRRC